MTLSELCKKDVIQLATGVRLGRADDLEFDRSGAVIRSLILFGRPRWFGLLGREENVQIPWEDVATIGTDVILVKTDLSTRQTSPRKGWAARWLA